jgi:hypothetical protein
MALSIRLVFSYSSPESIIVSIMEPQNLEPKRNLTLDPDQISTISVHDVASSTTRRRNALTPASRSVAGNHPPVPKYFHSRKIKKGSVERPWLDKKDPREKWVNIIPIIGVFVGFAIGAYLIWDGLRHVINHEYCLLLDENWSEGFNDKIWIKEAEVGGFG